MSKKRKRRDREEVPATADSPTRAGPRLLVALALAVATIVVGLPAALLQPWDPREPGAARRTPPDELAHVLYIEHLVAERRLPVLTSGAGLYEAHQPPLYYLSAIPVKLLGQAIDPRTEPNRPSTGEIRTERFWSVLIAAGVIVSCYLLACVVFPGSPAAQIAAPAFALLLPGHIVNVATVTNDGLAELFAALVLYVAARMLRQPPAGPKPVLLLGVLLGLALLTKTSCLFLAPVALLVVLLGCAGAGWRDCGLQCGLLLAVAAALWAPWIVHNLRHYPGDPLVTRTFIEVFGADRATPETFFAMGLGFLGYLRLVALWTYASFWGVFGEAAVFMPGGYYALGTLLSACIVGGLVVRARRWRPAPWESRAIWSVLAAACILVGLQFLKFNTEFFQAQARYLFPAIGAIACGSVAGLQGLAGLLLRGRSPGPTGPVWWPVVWGALLAIMLVWALVEVASRGTPIGPPGWIGLPLSS